MKKLHIIIKRKYFDQILTGEKTEEYRLIKDYWVKKLVNKSYTHIIFQAGYLKSSPKIEIEFLGYSIKILKHEFFGDDTVCVFAIKLGKITNA